MTTTIVLQQAINGVVLGSLYVLVALGLTLIYGVLVQINFAHADFVTLGAFAAYFFMHLVGGGYVLSIAVAFIVGAALGWLINAAIFTPLRHKGNELLPLIATIGVSVMMQNLMLAWFGPIPYAFETQYSSEVIRFAGIFVSWQSVIIIIVSILTIALLYAFMKFTFLGKALRAVAQDRETAGLMGINPNYLIMLTFVIASALAGMGGAMLAPVLVLTPFAGTSVIVKAFAIVIIGGFGNVEGTILAGLIVGLIESYTTQFLDPGLIDIVVFALLLVMLAIKPTGLISERREENVRSALAAFAARSRRVRGGVWRACGIAVIIVLPLIFNDTYWRTNLTVCAINVLLAIGLDFILGYAGQLNLGHSAFYGLGAYVSTLLIVKLGIPFWVAFIAGVAFAGIAGTFLSLFAVRLRGHYLAIASLGFAVIVHQILLNWISLTQGPLGIYGIAPPPAIVIGGVVIADFRNLAAFFYLVAGFAFLSYILLSQLVRSPIGETLTAIREDEVSAASLGINGAAWKVFAFGVGSAVAGAAGCFYASFVGTLVPDAFFVSEAFTILAMVIVGGMGTLIGPVFGAILLTVLPEVLRGFGDLRLVVYGAALTFVVLFMPGGLAQAARVIAEKLGLRRSA
jgi:ABC-type branched-subunit amino acid transport system permease subunit